MSLKVLLVDGNPVSRRAVKTLLESMGHAVVEAEDGQTALTLVEVGAIDFVITDLSTPIVSGIDLYRHVRAKPELAYIPVLLLTATPICVPEWSEIALVRPVTREDLDKCISNALARNQGTVGEEKPA